MKTKQRILSTLVCAILLVSQVTGKSMKKKGVPKTNIVTTKAVKPPVSANLVKDEYVVISSDTTEVEYTDINNAGETGDYVIVEEESVIYVTEIEDGPYSNGNTTTTVINYDTEENDVGGYDQGDGAHVVVVTHEDNDNNSEGREIIIVDGIEVPLDSDDNENVIIVVDGDYDYDSGNGEGEAGQDIVIIIEEPPAPTDAPVIITLPTTTTAIPTTTTTTTTTIPTTTTTTTIPTTTATTTLPVTIYIQSTTSTTTTTPTTTTTTPTTTTTTTTPTTTTTTTTTTRPTTTTTTTTPATIITPAPTPATVYNASCGCTVVINNNNYNYYNGPKEVSSGQGKEATTGQGKTQYQIVRKYPVNGVTTSRQGRTSAGKIANKQRMASNGNGIRRRYLTGNMVTRNLGKATGTGNVQVYRVLKTGTQKQKPIIVKSLRKRATPVFRIRPNLQGQSSKKMNRNNTVSWRVVPKWKAQRMQKLGLNTKIGKLETRRIAAPNANQKQKVQNIRVVNNVKNGKKLRYNNSVMRMNKRTGNTYNLERLNLGLQNRLQKRKVSQKFVQKKP